MQRIKRRNNYSLKNVSRIFKLKVKHVIKIEHSRFVHAKFDRELYELSFKVPRIGSNNCVYANYALQIIYVVIHVCTALL